jgi:disulfide bond formation protein DsbB
MTIEFYNLFITTLALISLIVGVVGLITLLVSKKESKVVSFVSENYQAISLIFAIASILGSLTYSEYFGFIPCKLCWFQRIFLYPVAVISAIALLSKEKIAPKYYLGLAIPGLLVSSYHTYSQLSGAEMECGVIGQSASCGDIWVKGFGFMTIPAMAGVCGIMIILANLYRLKAIKK